MNFLSKVWQFLDGKKVVIGSAILVASDVQPLIPHAAILTPAIPYIKGIAYSMIGVGGLHKIYKAGQSAAPVVDSLPESKLKQIVQTVIASIPADVKTDPEAPVLAGTVAEVPSLFKKPS